MVNMYAYLVAVCGAVMLWWIWVQPFLLEPFRIQYLHSHPGCQTDISYSRSLPHLLMSLKWVWVSGGVPLLTGLVQYDQ